MSFQHTLKLALTSSLVILSFQSIASDDLIKSCNSCHTPTEQGVPVINGISAFALETSLLAYVEDSRVARLYKNDDMKSIMTKLSDADFKKIIDHYPAQAFIPIKQAFNPELAAKGKVLHESYCSRCHTEGGSLADDDSSILAGQWKSYIIEEMKNYKDGSRIGDRKMTEVTKSLSDEHIQALAEYYASQQ